MFDVKLFVRHNALVIEAWTRADGGLCADARQSDVLTSETLARVFGVHADIRVDANGHPIVDVLEAIKRPS